MGYQTASGRWASTQDLSFAPAAQTATGNIAGIEVGDRGVARLFLDVTAVSGTTPSMTVSVDTSHDNSTWVAVAAFAAKTAVSNERKIFAGLNKWVRLSWTISGTTPSFTFTVTGDAV